MRRIKPLVDARLGWNSRFELNAAVFAANNIVAFDHSGNAKPCAAIFHAAFDANHFAQSAHKNFTAVCDFGRQRHRDIKFGAGFQILIENEIQATRGDVSRLALLRVRQALGWDANDYRQRQVITSSGSTFRHYTHPPLRPRSRWKRPRPFPANFSSDGFESEFERCHNDVSKVSCSDWAQPVREQLHSSARTHST